MEYRVFELEPGMVVDKTARFNMYALYLARDGDEEAELAQAVGNFGVSALTRCGATIVHIVSATNGAVLASHRVAALSNADLRAILEELEDARILVFFSSSSGAKFANGTVPLVNILRVCTAGEDMDLEDILKYLPPMLAEDIELGVPLMTKIARGKPARAKEAKPAGAPSEELTKITKFSDVVEKIPAIKNLTDNVLKLAIEENWIEIVPANSIATSVTPKKKGKTDPMEVLQRAIKNAPVPVVMPTAAPAMDTLHTMELKASYLGATSSGQKLIDLLFLPNAVPYDEKKSRSSQYIMEHIHEMLTTSKMVWKTSKSNSFVKRSAFAAKTKEDPYGCVNVSVDFSAMSEPFNISGLRSNNRMGLNAAFDLDLKEGRFRVTHNPNKTSMTSSREIWMATTAAELAEKILSHVITSENAFDACVYAVSPHIVNLVDSKETLYGKNGINMRAMTSLALAGFEHATLAGIPVQCGIDPLEAIPRGKWEDMPEENEARDALLKRASDYYMHRFRQESSSASNISTARALMLSKVFGEDGYEKLELTPKLFTNIAASEISPAAVGIVLAMAEELVTEIKMLMWTINTILIQKIWGAIFQTFSGDNYEVVYGLSPSSPNIVESFTKYKRQAYVAIPAELMGSGCFQSSAMQSYDTASEDSPPDPANLLAGGTASKLQGLFKHMKSNLSAMLSGAKQGNTLVDKIELGKTKPVLMVMNGHDPMAFNIRGYMLSIPDRIKLENKYKSIVDSMAAHLYLISDRRPFAPFEIMQCRESYSIHGNIISHINTVFGSTVYRATENPHVRKRITDQEAAFLTERHGAIPGRARVGECYYDRVHNLMINSVNGQHHGVILDTSTISALVDRGSIPINCPPFVDLTGMFSGNYARGACMSTTTNSMKSINISVMNRGGKSHGNTVRRLSRIISTKNDLKAYAPNYTTAIRSTLDGPYVSYSSKIFAIEDLKDAILNLEGVSTAPKVAAGSWIDVATMREFRMGQRQNENIEYLEILAESFDITKHMFVYFDVARKEPKVFDYHFWAAIASRIHVDEFLTVNAEESEVKEMDSTPYIPTELSKAILTSKQRVISEEISAKKKRLRALREEYAKAYREMVPTVRKTAHELRRMKDGAILKDEEILHNLIRQGEILGARVVGKDIAVLLPEANIWANGMIYNIGQIILVLESFATSNQRTLFFNQNHLGLRYPSAERSALDISGARTIDAPHVRNGQACLGNIAPALKEAATTGDLLQTILLCKSYLGAVNLSDAYGGWVYKWPSVPATLYNLVKFGVLHTAHESQRCKIILSQKFAKEIRYMTYDRYCVAFEGCKDRLEKEGYIREEFTQDMYGYMVAACEMGRSAKITLVAGEKVVPNPARSAVERSLEVLKAVLQDPKSMRHLGSQQSPSDRAEGACIPEWESEEVQKRMAELHASMADSKKPSFSFPSFSYWTTPTYTFSYTASAGEITGS